MEWFGLVEPILVISLRDRFIFSTIISTIFYLFLQWFGLVQPIFVIEHTQDCKNEIDPHPSSCKEIPTREEKLDDDLQANHEEISIEEEDDGFMLVDLHVKAKSAHAQDSSAENDFVFVEQEQKSSTQEDVISNLECCFKIDEATQLNKDADPELGTILRRIFLPQMISYIWWSSKYCSQ